MAVCGTEFTLLHHSTFAWHQGPVGACHDTAVTTNTFVLVDDDQAILLADGSRNAAFQAEWFTAVAAVHCKADGSLLFYLYPRVQGFILQSLHHIQEPAVGVGTVVLAKMAG